jgi:polar amino acid transport system substrate-binding protein
VKVRRVYAVAVLAAALAVAGCANNEGSEGGGGQPSASASGANDPNAVQKDDALAAQVPDAVKADGKLVFGTDPTYEPNEFKDASGKIIGFDVDLGTAIAKKLGLTADFQESKFDNIIPSIGSKYELGMSSFTDSKEREQTVDFVTYFKAGTAWAAKDTSVDPDNACGKKVAVQTATVQVDDLTARSKKCTDAGKPKITIDQYQKQSDATNAVVTGKDEAMLADSPVIAYAVKQTNGQLELAGDIYDSAPYGYVIAKDQTEFADAIKQAVQALITDGTYKTIATKWGVEAGAITTPEVNPKV